MTPTTSSPLKRFLNTPYLAVALCVYACFFINGAGIIAIAQNMNYLMDRWGVTESEITWVISGNVVGRLLSYYVAGYLSDKLGRKLMLQAGIFFYVVFFVGILLSPNPEIAFVFSVICGFANASLDTSIYPLQMEIFTKSSATAMIFCKAALSLGQLCFPYLVAFLLMEEMWMGYSFVVPAILFVLIGFILLIQKFPPHEQIMAAQNDAKNTPIHLSFKSQPTLRLDALLLVLYGCFTWATFYVFVVWISKYAANFAEMTPVAAQKTVSYYAFGSLVCIAISAYLFNRLIRPVFLMSVFPCIASITALTIYLHPTPAVCNVGAFFIGFTAAGGLLQLGLTVLLEFFPKSKARMLSIYLILSSLSGYGAVYISGKISTLSIQYNMLFDATLAGSTTILGILIFIRYYKIFSVDDQHLRFGERYIAK
ncbi:MAG: MFS transporter [Saezia sp.]